MNEIEIAIGKSKYQISCEESKKEEILNAATKLNEIVNALSFKMRGVDKKTLLVMAALSIGSYSEKVESTNKSPEISERDVFDAVSENMENVADYLEKLVKKITK